jgi:hypothetical protein
MVCFRQQKPAKSLTRRVILMVSALGLEPRTYRLKDPAGTFSHPIASEHLAPIKSLRGLALTPSGARRY